MKENTSPAVPQAQPMIAPTQPQPILGSLTKLGEEDPFSSLAPPNQPRTQAAMPGAMPGMQNPNMAAMQQQYMAQAQMYQQMHGVPYPYPFQQWMQIMNPTPGAMPGMQQPGMMQPGMMPQQPGMMQPGMAPAQPGMMQPGMMNPGGPQPTSMPNIGAPQPVTNIASQVAQQENSLFGDLVKTDLQAAKTLPSTAAPLAKPTATLGQPSAQLSQPSMSLGGPPLGGLGGPPLGGLGGPPLGGPPMGGTGIEQKKTNNPFDF